MNIIRQIDILESCWIKSGSDVLKAVSLLLFIFLSFFFLWKLNSFSASYYRNSSLRNCSDILENYLMGNWDNYRVSWYVHSDFFSEASSGLKTRQKKKTTHFVSCSSTFVFMSIISRGTSCSSFSFSSPPGWPKPHMASYNWNDRLG